MGATSTKKPEDERLDRGPTRPQLEKEELGGWGAMLDAFSCVRQTREMKPFSNFVSLHPYFKVHPGKLEAFKAGFPAFVEPPS